MCGIALKSLTFKGMIEGSLKGSLPDVTHAEPTQVKAKKARRGCVSLAVCEASVG